jgi:hypothetical protein
MKHFHRDPMLDVFMCLLVQRPLLRAHCTQLHREIARKQIAKHTGQILTGD